MKIRPWMLILSLMVLFSLYFMKSFIFITATTYYNRIADEFGLKSVCKKIFFCETSGVSELNIRQACAVESTARHHPESNVEVFMFTSQPIRDRFKFLHKFNNVKLRAVTFDGVFNDTPLTKWYNEKKWEKSVYEVTHKSDAVRYALIWKYGGIYLDLDVVMLKSLSSFNNFVIKEHDKSLGSSVFGIKEKKHPLMLNCILGVLKEYKADNFGCIGPPLFTSNFISYCNGTNLNELQNCNNCNFTILNPTAAFPIIYTRWKDYFSKDSAEETLRKMNSSYLIHVWNFATSKERVNPGSGSAYEQAMANNCPYVYEQAVKIGNI